MVGHRMCVTYTGRRLRNPSAPAVVSVYAVWSVSVLLMRFMCGTII